MQLQGFIEPIALPIDSSLTMEAIRMAGAKPNRKKRELREEDSTLYQIRKKFAALGEGELGLAEPLNVECVTEDKEGTKMKFAKENENLIMEDIKYEEKKYN